MRLDRALTISVVRPLHGTGLSRPEAALPILMYHSIADEDESAVAPYYRLTTSPARFRAQVRCVVENGYSVIALDEALRRLGSGSEIPNRTIVITFDDGFRDFMTQAWPVLADVQATATMFLPTSYIAREPGRFKGRECLSWRDVRDLHAQGASFGTHTANHPVLYRLPWQEIRQELRDSKLRLEDELQVAARTFAYPYAFPQEDRAFVRRFTAELVDQGYHAAVTTVIGRAEAGANRLCLKRLPVNDADDEQLFLSKLSGAYDWMGRFQLLTRRARRALNRVEKSTR